MPGITMDFHELPTYQHMIEDVRSRFASEMNIKIAMEADFIPVRSQD